MSSVPTNLTGDASFGHSGHPPVVKLTREQSESSLIELHDADGKSRGLLLHDGGMTVLYTPERLAELRRRASTSKDQCRTLREVIDFAIDRARKLAELPKE